MKILDNLNLVKNSAGSFLFFDTNSLIAVITNEKEFFNILVKLQEYKYSFVTIPSVIFEFTRTDSIEGYNKRTKFIKRFLTSFPIEKYLDKNREIIPILQKINGKMSYSDFLLYCCLYQFSNSYLITENHKDFLTAILNRTGLLTLESDFSEIRNLGLYTFSHEKYQKAASNILRSE